MLSAGVAGSSTPCVMLSAGVAGSSTLTIDDPRHPQHPKGCTNSCCVVQRKPDSDEEGEEEVTRQLMVAKRQRLRSIAPSAPAMGSTERVLTYSFPESRGLEANSNIVKAFKQCEKFEIACQGDDHADKELRATNSEALLYSRAAAVIAGQDKCLHATRERMGESGFNAWLATLPFIGANRAKQISEIITSGTCEALESFRRGAAPIAISQNARRLENGAGRSMANAPCKLELSKVFGISSMRAINLVNGTLRDELPPVRSVVELRRSRAHLEALGMGVGRDGILAASLAHFEELQAAVPASTAEDMRATVLGILRAQHTRRVGAPRDCPPSVPPAPPCRCCWHADFVGGARTKGRAGHDVDLLLWHHSEPNSWGPGAEQCVVLPLLAALEASGRLLPPEEGRRQLVRRDHKAKQPDAATGERGYMKVKGPSIQKGIENLQGDWHDKLLGLWRTPLGLHHRIDVVVVAHPEELPFARLTWTGSRSLNRLMRLRAIELGLNLNSNGLSARGDPPEECRARSDPMDTRVVIEARPGHEPLDVVVCGRGVVPFQYLRSEEDIIRVLARGTDAFAGIYDPRHRNA